MFNSYVSHNQRVNNIINDYGVYIFNIIGYPEK